MTWHFNSKKLYFKLLVKNSFYYMTLPGKMWLNKIPLKYSNSTEYCVKRYKCNKILT